METYKRRYIKRTKLKKALEFSINERVDCYYELHKSFLLIYIAQGIFVSTRHLNEIAEFCNTSAIQIEGRIIIFYINNMIHPVIPQMNKFLDKCKSKINAKIEAKSKQPSQNP